MISRYHDHFRFIQKNLFLGESLSLFMSNPGTPGTPGSSGMNTLSEGAEGPLLSALDGQAQKRVREKQAIADAMKEFVPERTKALPGEHIEIREEWMELMGDYNGVQTQINVLLEYQTKFQDPATLAKDPNFAKTYREFYQRIQSLKTTGLTGVNWAELEEKAGTEFRQRTATLLRDIQNLLTALVNRRKIVWETIEERIHHDFGRRLENLKNTWNGTGEKKPPKGFESAGPKWIEYLNNVERQLKAHHFQDTDKPENPAGSRHFKELMELWNSIADCESTIEMWRQGQESNVDFNVLEREVAELEKERKRILTPALKNQYVKAVDDVVGPLRNLVAELERNYVSGKDQAEELKKTLKGLEESRDLDAQFEDMLNNDDTLMQVQRSGTVFNFPKGIKNQIAFLKTFPINETETRHMLGRMQESINAAKASLLGTEKYTTETLPNLLKKVQLYKDKLDQPKVTDKRKLMWISGPKTYDVIKHTLQSLFERSYKRDNDRKAGIFGKDAFKFLNDIPGVNKFEFLRPFSEIHSEFDAHREHAETEGFQHYEKVHEHASLEHIIHVMHDTDNEFEFRGVIGLLSKKGRMRWDDTAFFKQLNKFQKRVWVPISIDRHYEDLVQSEELIKEAIFGIYGDPDIYRNWQSQNASGLASEKKNKSARYGEMSEQRVGRISALQAKIDGILKKYEADHAAHKHFSDADPIEYEAILDYAIEQGKLDNEDVLYYMIKGIGLGLLPMERGSEMTGKNNNYPAIEFFSEKIGSRGDRPTKTDLEELAQMSKDEYVHWYHSYVMYLPKVFQRLNKAQSQGVKMDHDYFTGTAAYLGASAMDSLLQANQAGGGYGLQITAAQNGTVGMLFGLDVLAEEYNDLNQKDGRGTRGITRMVDMIVRFDATVTGRMHRNENYLRLDYNALNTDKPRYAGQYQDFFGRGPNMTAGQNLATMRNYFRILDFDTNYPLLNMLFDNRIKTDQEAANVAEQLMLKYPGIFGDLPAPTTIDKLYEAVGNYVAYISKERPEKIAAMNAQIIRDHRNAGKSVAKLKFQREDTARRFRKRQAEKIKQGLAADDHAHGEHGGGHGGDHGGGHGGDHGGGHGGEHGDDSSGSGNAGGPTAHGSTPVGGGPTASASTHH